jgi:DNA-binding transcriptional regulator YdaS (Cro superfamily)
MKKLTHKSLSPDMPPLERAVAILGGYSATGRVCGVSFMSVIKWVRKGHLPRTEWTGETNYADRIASAIDGIVSREELLSTRPTPRSFSRESSQEV